jgi:hypothetical protein
MELGATHFAAKPLFENDLRRILYQSKLDQEPSI